MRFAKNAHVLSCVYALPILLLARREGQLVSLSECKLLTGAPKGVIVVNRANIFVIPRAEPDQNYSRIVQAVLPTQS